MRRGRRSSSVGASWPCQNQHQGPEPVLPRCCRSSGTSRARSAVGREGHSPTALPGTIREAVDAQGGFITGLSRVPKLA